MRPALSPHYYVVPRQHQGGVLAFRSYAFNRFYPVAAISAPVLPGLLPFPRLSAAPLPHLPTTP
ncbi:MAG: hypothetical protein NVS3B25_34740 [Hymenobacter sp.]